MRLLGIKIQGEYSSEARVFARLLGARPPALDARVIYQAGASESDHWREFEADARALLLPVDVGYRRRMGSLAEKASALIRFRRSFEQLVQSARAYDPHVVYSSQQFWDCCAASYVARRLGRPHVIHLHYAIGPWLRTGFSRSPASLRLAAKGLRLGDPLERLQTCEQVIAISDFIRGEALGFGLAPHRVATIRNPVALLSPLGAEVRRTIRASLGIPAEAPLIGIVGRLDPDKGHADTLAAFARIAPQHAAAHLLVVGAGPLEASLRADNERFGLAGRVHFTGWRADVPALLAAMDVFSHPSRREPFGLAVAEAAAAGLPVVAYEEGALPEIVRDHDTGLLVRPGDISALAATLGDLLRRPEESRAMGARGRERVAREFRPEDAAAQLATLVERVATERGSVSSVA